jgi:DNA-binding response OmpR family regulator
LTSNPNKAMTRETILEAVWGDDFFGSDRTVDTHIKSLRKQIRPFEKYINTVWGYGYMFKA